MKVRIISKTTDALEVLYTAARTCYSEHNPSDIFDVLGDAFGVSTEEQKELVINVLNRGHWSIARHANITFAITGISRSCSHQLVRHQAGFSFSQQSQRYVNMSDTSFVIPVKNSIIDDTLLQIQDCYKILIDQGVKQEDARCILPNACTTNLVVTCNLQALKNFCSERLCTKAQYEIRELANRMKDEVLLRYNWMDGLLEPKCIAIGKCNELKGCGYYANR